MKSQICLNCSHVLSRKPFKEAKESEFCSDWCTADYKNAKKKNKRDEKKKEESKSKDKPLKNIKNNTIIRPYDKSNREISEIMPVD